MDMHPGYARVIYHRLFPGRRDPYRGVAWVRGQIVLMKELGWGACT